MSDLAQNILPETRELISHARRLSSHPLSLPYPNLGALLTARTSATPERPWLTFYGEEGRSRTLTYAEFDLETRRMAALLSGLLGIAAGDRVATLMVNDWRTVLIYFAVWSLGATVVPINCGEDEERIVYILENSGAKALFAHGEQIERAMRLQAQLPTLRFLIQASTIPHSPTQGAASSAPTDVASPTPNAKRQTPDPSLLDLDSQLQSTPPLETLPEVPSDTECLIVYTSGTTGAPKGVVLEQANLLADAESIAAWHRFGPEDRAMCVLPIHHVNGMIVTLVTPLFFGGSVVLNHRFRAQTFWQTLAEERCTYVSVVPTVLAFLCERHDDLTRFDLACFRHIICGAGPLTVEMARRFQETFGVRVVHGYGLSETTCYSCFLPIDLDEADYRTWMFECGFPSIGCPISVNEMAIHDSEGNPLPPDTRGEIVARGYNVMRWYFQRPDANRDTFAHGWFRSGDEGFYRVGRDGLPYFFITGRLKELIIRGGVNYSPFDIDEVLNAIPGVKAAMAVGFDNDFYGEEVGAYVQLEPGASLDELAILQACRESLPFSKCPKVVVFGDTFPVTSTGKYQRNKLKPLFVAWKETQFRESK